MFFVLTERLVKRNTGATAQYAPRTANQTFWSLLGPFSKRSLAERTVVSAAGTHTCLAAHVLTIEQLRRIATDVHKDYHYTKCAIEAVNLWGQGAS